MTTPDENAALVEFLERSGEAISRAIEELLEKKHLYQSVRVRFKEFYESLRGGAIPTGRIEEIGAMLSKMANLPWASVRNEPVRMGGEELPAVKFGLPNVKVYCDVCRRLEPFHPTTTTEVSRGAPFSLSRGRPRMFQPAEPPAGGYVQHWALGYHCQSCTENQSAFLIRRSGQFVIDKTDLKLQLCGRAPIEHVDVPTHFPKVEGRFFENGQVAFNSGQTLAGLFLLRTMIEKFCRRIIGRPPSKGESGGDIVAEYTSALPGDFKQRFPSLANLYSLLSGAIHEADDAKEGREYSELFRTASDGISEHFDARRLFKLPS